MASTRSSTPSRRAARSARASTPRDAILAVVREGSRVQIAAAAAAAKTLADSAQAAARFVEAAGDELLRRISGEITSAELVARLANVSNTHLRDLTALPCAAADHFDTSRRPR
jgi:type VI protein secretion system component VasF